MNNKTTIQNMIKEWGQKKQQLPPHNNALKSQVLSKYSPQASCISSPKRTWKLPLVPALLAGFAVIAFLISVPSKHSLPTSSQSSLNTSFKSTEEQDRAASYAPTKNGDVYPIEPPFTGVPITDTRELLKTDYSASIKTRHITETSDRIQTSVRSFGGRIDQASNSPEYGSISFVLPARDLNAFRTETKNLVGTHFYTENISSENLLPQKRNIEEQTKTREQNLQELHAQRDTLTAEHKRLIASLQSQINALSKEITTLQTEKSTATPEQKLEIETALRALQNQNNGLQTQIRNENTSFTNKMSQIDTQIKNTEETITALGKQDTQLLDTVATVRGTISLDYASAWEMINLYLPPYWIALVFLLAAAGAYIINHRRSRIIIP